MDFNSEDTKQEKSRLSESIYMDKNMSKLTKEKKKFFLIVPMIIQNSDKVMSIHN